MGTRTVISNHKRKKKIQIKEETYQCRPGAGGRHAVQIQAAAEWEHVARSRGIVAAFFFVLLVFPPLFFSCLLFTPSIRPQHVSLFYFSSRVTERRECES